MDNEYEEKISRTEPAVIYTTVGSVVLLNGLANGTGQSQRLGGKVTVMRLESRWTIRNGATATVNPTTRTIFFWDHQTNGAAPTLAQLLTAVTVNSGYNVDNVFRFTIFEDSTHTQRVWAQNAGGIVAPADVASFTTYSKHGYVIDEDTVYSDAGATVASINSGGLFVATLSDVAAGTGAPTATMDSRIIYLDD